MKKSRAENRYDEGLLLGYLVTLVAGLIMVYSTSSIIAESRFGSHLYFLKHQMIWTVLSLLTVFVIYRLDLKRLAVYSVPALMLTFVLLMLVFVMPARNGSHRWLTMGPLTLQPSELFKFLVVAYLAFSLSNPKRNLGDPKQLAFPYVPIIGLGLALILAEPDLGTCVVLCLTALGMFFLAGARLRHLYAALVPPALIASFFVFVLGYKKARILDYVASVIDPIQGGYHVRQAALTLGCGGLLGTGLGEGRQKLFYLPYPHTDFVFAATGEEIGLLGLLLVMGLLSFLLWRGWKIAAAQPDRFGFLLGAGMTWSLFVNIAINIAVVTSLLPVTGLALPFFSYGGSSLLMSSAAVGVLLNLSRRVAR
ncbi:MAG TPA: putative lipid II flippase FtsW [Acidobacteriota bacterium]|nr:putative lipid II flippase FtsW [Acidobacteriota bacterium]